MKYFLIFLTLIFVGCTSDEFQPDFDLENVTGFRPIYAQADELDIAVESARSIGTAGKIYSYGDILLVNERGLGVHVYDNTDPKNPENKFFVAIPGNNDIAMKAGVLYADSFDDLLTLEFSADTVILLKRLEHVMGRSSNGAPEQRGVYFECVDESKGIVVAWEEAELNQPKCYKP
ncbi:MAG: hypothetical protein JXR10_09670 [Cyclobacteriaceae bacterium]